MRRLGTKNQVVEPGGCFRCYHLTSHSIGEWALTATGRALSLLEKEFSDTGKGEQFQVLKPWLVGEVEGQGAGPSLSQAEAARRLGLSEGAVKVLVHRLRKRFRDAVRLEISHTLRERSLVDEELRHLIDALS